MNLAKLSTYKRLYLENLFSLSFFKILYSPVEIGIIVASDTPAGHSPPETPQAGLDTAACLAAEAAEEDLHFRWEKAVGADRTLKEQRSCFHL